MSVRSRSVYRGFALIELLIALAVCSIALSSAALAFYVLPYDVQSIEQEYRAWQDALEALRDNPLLPADRLDDGAARRQSETSWTDASGRKRSVSIAYPDVSASSTDACDPLVSGDWSRPRAIRTYSVSDLLPANAPSGTYPVSALAVAGPWFAVGVAQTSTSSAPTLLFLPDDGNTLAVATASFDNASTSRIGFSALAAGGGYLFAGNGFGSASAATCSDSMSCSQVQVFSISGAVPMRVASLSFPLVSSDGTSATVGALAYANGLLYIGLHKTSTGQEFLIIDAHDPLRMRLAGSLNIGHSVTNIGLRDGIAYISTDDSSREVLVVNVQDPARPSIVSNMDAPGSANFGYGVAAVPYFGSLLIGRSYVSNAPEVTLVSDASSSWSQLAADDIGKAKTPESVRALLRQDFLAFALTSRALRIYSVVGVALQSYAPPLPLPDGADGTALACRGATIYAGYAAADGSGDIEMLQGS